MNECVVLSRLRTSLPYIVHIHGIKITYLTHKICIVKIVKHHDLVWFLSRNHHFNKLDSNSHETKTVKNVSKSTKTKISKKILKFHFICVIKMFQYVVACSWNTTHSKPNFKHTYDFYFFFVHSVRLCTKALPNPYKCLYM